MRQKPKSKRSANMASTCASKVRFVLAEKGLPYQSHYVDLLKGEQFRPDYLKLNPLAVVRHLTDHLKPGGMFVAYNYYREGWVVARLAELTRAAFGQDGPREEAIEEIRYQARSGKGIEAAYQEARRWADDAGAQLNGLPAGIFRDLLRGDWYVEGVYD